MKLYNDLHLRTLALADAPNLLAFELMNRAWFEQQVEARTHSFYDLDGVQAHIGELLMLHQQDRFHPLLIVNGAGAILGRANLKDIDQQIGCAELGYRVGQDWAGRGLASFAVWEMITLARQRWGLRRLQAFVAVNNPASARVLMKNGFERAECHPGMAHIQGRQVDCHRYERALGDPEGQALAPVLGGSVPF